MRSMMHRALSSKAVLSPEFQRHAFALATSSEDTALLLALVRRADAPEDLQATYRADKRVEVRACFLTRPSTSKETLEAEVRAEKRAGVLTAVVKDSSTSPELLEVIEETFRAKPTKSLAEAFATARPDTVTLSTALVVVPLLEKSWDRLTSSVSQGLLALVKRVALDAPSAALLAPELSHPALAQELLSADLGPEAAAHLVEVLARASAEALTARYHYGYRVLPSSVSTAARAVAAAHPVEGPRVLADALSRIPQWVCAERLELEELLFASGASLAAPDVTGLPKDQARARLLTHQALVSSSPKELTKVLSALLVSAATNDRGAVTLPDGAGRRLATNPALGLDDARRLLGVEGDHRKPALAAALAKRLADPALASLVVRSFPGSIDPDVLAMTEDPTAVLDEVGAAAARNWLRSTTSRYYSYNAFSSDLTRILSQPVFPPEVAARHLPWRVFEDYAPVNEAALYTFVSACLSERLGTDAAAWETFSGLASGFDGTLGELLDVAETLA
jgi:hypothetical protein